MCRKGKELGVKERFYIEMCLKDKMSHSEIARKLGVSRQCIDYEVKKGMVIQMDTLLCKRYVYSADYSQGVYDRRKLGTGRQPKFSSNDELLINIEKVIRENNSPYSCVKKLGCEDLISVRTIYNYVRKGYMPSVSYKDMPYMKKKVVHKDKPCKIKIDFIHSIERRPESVKERKVFGHWEGDTVYSAKDCLPTLLVLTERKTRMNINIKMKDRTQTSVSEALKRLERKVGVKNYQSIFKTITFDNGTEFRNAELLELKKKDRKSVQIYYAHPYSSFERGSNEIQNKMIRRWIPKGDNIGLYSNKEIATITNWQNKYPRKLFNGKSSADMLFEEYLSGSISEVEYYRLQQLCCV